MHPLMRAKMEAPSHAFNNNKTHVDLRLGVLLVVKLVQSEELGSVDLNPWISKLKSPPFQAVWRMAPSQISVSRTPSWGKR